MKMSSNISLLITNKQNLSLHEFVINGAMTNQVNKYYNKKMKSIT